MSARNYYERKVYFINYYYYYQNTDFLRHQSCNNYCSISFYNNKTEEKDYYRKCSMSCD